MSLAATARRDTEQLNSQVLHPRTPKAPKGGLGFRLRGLLKPQIPIKTKARRPFARYPLGHPDARFASASKLFVLVGYLGSRDAGLGFRV